MQYTWPALQAEYRPLCHAMITALQQEFPKQLHSIYLYGSVAHAQACVGQSDIDFCVIFNQPLSQVELEKLHHLQKHLQQKFILVSKIDIDIGDLQTLTRPDQQRRWYFWLQRFCRPIFGVNLAKNTPPIPVDYQLLWEINVDYQEDLNNYFKKLSQNTYHSTAENQYYKSLIKRIIRLLALSWPTAQDWPMSLVDTLQHTYHLYPELKTDLDFLAQQYHSDISINQMPDFSLQRLRLQQIAARLETYIQQQYQEQFQQHQLDFKA